MTRTENDLRAALASLERHTPDADRVLAAVNRRAGGSRPERSWPRAGRSARRATLGLGLTLTAGAAAIAVFAATAGTGAPPAGGNTGSKPGQTVLSARDILLAAATSVGRAPLTTGRYWLTRTTGGDVEPVGRGGGRYTVLTQTRGDTWTARSASDTSWFVGQYLGAKPSAPADLVAWRRDGSPSTWMVVDGQIKVAAGHRGTAAVVVPGAPGKPYGNPSNVGDKVFALGAHNVSMRDLQALPADAARLKALLLGFYTAPGGSGGDLPTDRNQWLYEVGVGIVVDMPVPSAVRAAAYRMLADLPGVRSLGTVRDAAGRVGAAVAITETDSNGTLEDRLIVDAASGLALAQEDRYLTPGGDKAWLKPGELWTYQLVQFAGWTNDTPPRVAAPGGQDGGPFVRTTR